MKHRPKTTLKLQVMRFLDYYEVGEFFSFKDFVTKCQPIGEILPLKDLKGGIRRTLKTLVVEGYLSYNKTYQILKRPLPPLSSFKASKLWKMTYQALLEYEKKIKSFEFEVMIPDMVDRQSLRLDFRIFLWKPNFLGYREIWIEANGDQHLEPTRRFKGWRGFVNLSKKFNIKRSFVLRKDVLMVITEGSSYKKIKEMIAFALKDHWIGDLKYYSLTHGFTFESKEFKSKWVDHLPNISTWDNTNFKTGKIAFCPEDNVVVKQGYDIFVIVYRRTHNTAQINLHKYNLETQWNNYPIIIIALWGDITNFYTKKREFIKKIIKNI